ncbi:MAG: NusG domain II-containing protein [Oscillospiraceae bacterium]|nr:NusG domain II-containing protein [Oscillospiraceae bacterium]
MSSKIKTNSFIKKADVILFILLLITCAILILPSKFSKVGATAKIYLNGEIIESIDLSTVKETYSFELDSTPSVEITVEPNCIYYSKADCPDKLCINCGRLSHPGDTAACLPSETLIVLEGQKDKDQPDALTY